MKKSKEDLNTAVITTKYILEGNSKILFVFHLEDGYWQFSGAEMDLLDKDYRIISLEEIIKIDNSILEISDLNFGEKAFRKSLSSPWEKL